MNIDPKNEIQRYKKYYKQLEPKLNKPAARAYTTVIFSFLVVSLFGWYAIRPTIQTIIHLKREIRDKTELSKKMEDKITALIEAQAYYQEIEPLLPVINESLPTNSDAIPLLIQLRNLASISGTLITAIQVPTLPITNEKSKTDILQKAKAVPGTTQKSYIVSLSLKGLYPNIRAYIDGILQMRRIVHIESISLVPVKAAIQISTGSGTQPERLLQLALKLKAYYLVD